MKKRLSFIGFVIIFLAEIAAITVFALQTPDISQDTVAVNEILQSVCADWNAMHAHENRTSQNYVVLDANGNVVFKTKSGLSETLNAAIGHRDTLLNVKMDGAIVGQVIVYNESAAVMQSQKRTTVILLFVAAAVQCVICVAYISYIDFRVLKPFAKLKDFARRVADGNLDVPLEMDKDNLFGAFTESFDIMRSELKTARLAEQKARQSKKELVAKLSHDIKTPVASIKAVSEVGLARCKTKKEKESYSHIIVKADQIDTLVSNLFTATLEELQQLIVTPINIDSAIVRELLENSDYLRRAEIPCVPECLIRADKLRLQQVFDNIFCNSYKYANTKIAIEIEKSENFLCVSVEDWGGGVLSEELPLLKEKFSRGSNTADKDGAGLGLYISDYFMKEMGGELLAENGRNGLKVTARIALSGKD